MSLRCAKIERGGPSPGTLPLLNPPSDPHVLRRDGEGCGPQSEDGESEVGTPQARPGDADHNER